VCVCVCFPGAGVHSNRGILTEPPRYDDLFET
jgi:hypothetical protein